MPVRVLGALHRRVVVDVWGGPVLGHRIADMAGDRLAGAVKAALLDPAAKILQRRAFGVECDRRRLRHRVRRDGEHAGLIGERGLDHGLLAGVVQSTDV
jgi:hypothetical protein